MSYTVKSLVYTEAEHTFEVCCPNCGRQAMMNLVPTSTRIIKGWQVIPAGPKPQKPKTREIETKLGETIEL